MSLDRHAFVRAQTRLLAPSLVPELRLHLAARATDLWEATEASLAQTGLPPPYWAFAWPGGQALARLLFDRPDLARGKTVLDFAAGCGVAGIAAATMGAASVVACEIDAFAAAAMELNAAANGVALQIQLGTDKPPPAELVLAGDIFYEKPMADRLWPWLQDCAAAGAEVLVADPGRAYLPTAGLVEIARYDVPTDRDLEDRDVRTTRVLRVVALGQQVR